MDTRHLFNLSTALKKVSELDQEMPIHHLQFLIFVALHPGCTQTEVGDALGVKSSTMTRITSKMSEQASLTEKGLGLVNNEIDPQHRSRRLLTLTPKGQRLMAAVSQSFK